MMFSLLFSLLSCRLTHQEGSEHGDGRQEVPDIMIVEEGEQDTLTVVLARLGRSFLETLMLIRLQR